MQFSDADVAKVVHEANRALQELLQTPGVPVSPPWEDAPEDQRRSAINGVRYTRENPDVTPEDSHDNWSREKWDNGWVWGEVKDPEAKTHPNLVPYSALPAGERAKDALFGAIVRALSD